MKKCVLVIGAILALMLLTQKIVGQDQGGSSTNKFHPIASGLLRRAVSKTRRCAAYPDKTENGKPAPIKTEEVSFAKKLEIKLVFAPGRFHLEQKPDSSTEDGKSEIVIAFKPWLEPREKEVVPGCSEDLPRSGNSPSQLHFDSNAEAESCMLKSAHAS